MTTLQPTTTTQQTPRPSTETDRRHLLSPSGATSLLSSTQNTPRASLENPKQLRRGTLADPSPTQHPYRGFPSEAAYLAAFNEWAESKKYVQHDTNLVGFYGETTMQEYAARPRQEFGLSKRWRERKAKKEARRASAI